MPSTICCAVADPSGSPAQECKVRPPAFCATMPNTAVMATYCGPSHCWKRQRRCLHRYDFPLPGPPKISTDCGAEHCCASETRRPKAGRANWAANWAALFLALQLLEEQCPFNFFVERGRSQLVQLEQLPPQREQLPPWQLFHSSDAILSSAKAFWCDGGISAVQISFSGCNRSTADILDAQIAWRSDQSDCTLGEREACPADARHA